MPIFEYRCRRCDRNFEALVRGSETVECPHCQTADLEKLFSTPAAHVRSAGPLPVMSSCPPTDAPPCSPHCCRLQ